MVDANARLLDSRSRAGWLRLRTLVNLRWVAVIGQLVAVFVASYLLEISLRLDLCLVVIALSAAFNISSSLITSQTTRLSKPAAVWILLFDLGQLGVLLGLCGGLSNPFAALLLAPVVIASTALGTRPTAILVAAAATVILLLGFVYYPLRLADGTVLAPPPLLVTGNIAALLIAVGFVALYARRVSREQEAMSDALVATQMALAREQRLTALGGVVAAAAHELGTPLATIKLASSELYDELQGHPALRDDAALIRDQADRCRDILRDMGQSGKDDALLRHTPVLSLVQEAAAPHRNRGKAVILRIDGALEEAAPASQPAVRRDPETIHGLRNLVQNAVDFAANTVWIDIEWDARSLKIRIGDDGQGYPLDLIGRIGDPFVRRRSTLAKESALRPEYEGMGLGLFIAKTLLERTGGRLTFANGSTSRAQRASPSLGSGSAALARPTGAIVEVVWPLERIAQPQGQAHKPLGANPRNEV
ncbi:MAG: ActS/PrrB/RegB family redox-sensitive histidine kinase [Paracoccaceae bacterium]